MRYIDNVFNNIPINTGVPLPLLALLDMSQGHNAEVLLSKSNSMGGLSGPIPSMQHHLTAISSSKIRYQVWLVKYFSNLIIPNMKIIYR